MSRTLQSNAALLRINARQRARFLMAEAVNGAHVMTDYPGRERSEFGSYRHMLLVAARAEFRRALGLVS